LIRQVSGVRSLSRDDPFLGAVAVFGMVAAASFAAGWFSQGLFGAF